MNISEIDLKIRVLLSAQRALLGNVYPSIRAIEINFQNRKLSLISYLDRLPTDYDSENIQVISTEIFSDFIDEFDTVNEECKYSIEKNIQLDEKASLIYLRKEI